MATTDTRSGFRLPWNSDRSHENDPEQPAEAGSEATADSQHVEDAPAGESDGSEVGAEATWPEVDVNSRFSLVSGSPDSAGPASAQHSAKEPADMVDSVSAPPPSHVGTRKSSKLIADLAAAMRATAETAREQSQAQVEAEARQVVDTIRSRSTEGVATLRQRADEDIASVRDWSKAEIAHIREETDQRISARKAALETEVAGHAAAIDRRVDEVQRAVAEYETDVAEFFERLLQETDPARLATMAESMPEPPALAHLTDIDDLDISIVDEPPVEADAEEQAVEPPTMPVPGASTDPAAEAEMTATALTEPGVDTTAEVPSEEPPVGSIAVEPAGDEVPAAVDDGNVTEVQADVAGTPATADGASPDEAPMDDTVVAMAVAEAVPEVADQAPEVQPAPDSFGRWTESDGGWSTGSGTAIDAGASGAWFTGATDGSGSGAATGDDVGDDFDRGAMLAALEAAAEAGASEAQSDETAVGSMTDWGGGGDDAGAPAGDPGDETFDEPSLARRLASLLPGSMPADESETASTQLIVTGLISVASIASFKRHLGRVAGVRSISVSSGPEGEFVFNVSHAPEVSFRDVIPTLPGFAARVTGTDDGVVHVAARDPETEG